MNKLWSILSIVGVAAVAVSVSLHLQGTASSDTQRLLFVGGAVLCALGSVAALTTGSSGHKIAPLVAVAAVVALFGGAVASSSTDSERAGAANAVPAPANRCDLAFNTDSYNANAPTTHDHSHMGAATTTTVAPSTTLDPTLTEAERKAVEFAARAKRESDEGVASQGHSHDGLSPWQPMTRAQDCDALGTELGVVRQIAAAHPTVLSAEADGYHKVTVYVPGIAAHYMKFSAVDGTFDVNEPEMLLFDGTAPNASIVGVSYYILQSGEVEPTAGFTGPNDHYHQHIGLCIRGSLVVGSESISDEECAKRGGERSRTSDAWMSHVWIVPGCESDQGVFSASNPKLTIELTAKSGQPGSQGCGTGKLIEPAPPTSVSPSTSVPPTS